MTTLQTMRDEVSAQLGVTQSKARGAVDIIMDTLRAELLSHGEATLPGLGKLKVRPTAPRIIRNPRTGESMGTTTAGHRVTFKPTAALKAQVNE